jgi:hypothetical protein
MADSLEDILKRSPLTQKQRADLWDAYEGAGSEDELASALEKFQAPKEVKARLWDLKASSAPAAPERARTKVPDTPSMQPGAGQDQRGTAGHVLSDAGTAIVGGAGMVGDVVKGAAGLVKSAATYGMPRFDQNESMVDYVSRLATENPGVQMAKAHAQGVGDRVSAASAAADRGDASEATYQRAQAAMSVLPGYDALAKAGERAVGMADGQASVLEADPAAAGELAAQALLAKTPAVAGKAGSAVVRGTAKIARDTSEFLARSAIKPLVSSMKRAAGASATGVEAQANKMVRFIIDNKIATPEKAAKIIQESERELQRVLSLKNAPTDAATRADRYLGIMKKNASKAGLAEDQVASLDNAMKELVRGPMGEDVAQMVSKPSAILDSAGKPVMTQVEETVRKLRDEVPAKEALESARSSSKWQTRRAWGEQKGANTEAAKAVERAQRDAVKAAVPEAAPILRRQGQAIQAKEAMDRMAFREANREPAGLGAQVTMAAGAAAGAGAGAGVMAMALEVIRSGKLRGSFALDRLSKTLQNAVANNNPQQAALVLSKLGVTVAPRDLRPVAVSSRSPLPRAAEAEDEENNGPQVATR